MAGPLLLLPLASPKVLSLEKTKENEFFFWFFARLFVPLQQKQL